MESKKLSDFLILYGTQTNTAKYASEDLGRESLMRGLSSQIMPLDNYNIFDLPTEAKPVVFIIATTGDGDPPTTM